MIDLDPERRRHAELAENARRVATIQDLRHSAGIERRVLLRRDGELLPMRRQTRSELREQAEQEIAQARIEQLRASVRPKPRDRFWVIQAD